MPRALSAGYRQSIEATASDELTVTLLRLSHADLAVTLRVNSDVVDYVYGGETYYGIGVPMPMLSDDESLPQAKVWIPNVDQRIGEAVLALSSAPSIEIEWVVKSDFDDAVPRQPLGTPTVEYLAEQLYLRNVKCDAMGLSGDIVGKDLSTEAWPKHRTTPQDCPALFR